MNVAVTRLVWKEYRTQRALWLAIAGLGLLAQLFVVSLIDRPDEEAKTALVIAVAFAALFALGGTCVSFASEQEDGTVAFLRNLAASTSQLFVSKFGFVVAGTAVMFVALSVSAHMLTLFEGSATAVGTLRSGLETILNLLVWGLFASLLTRRVLTAACVTPLCLFISAAFTSGLGLDRFGGLSTNFGRIEVLARGALLLTVLAGDVWLTRRWLSGQKMRWWASPAETAPRRRTRSVVATEVREETPAWRRLMIRLLWQESRRARPIVLSYLAVFGLIVGATALMYRVTSGRAAEPFYLILGLGIVLAPTVMGVWCFRGEQEQRHFRFLSERGVSPQIVWLTKHLVWGSATALLLTAMLAATYPLVASGILLVSSGNVVRELFRPGSALFAMTAVQAILIVLSTYSIGQLVSMLIPQAITAALVGIVLSAVAIVWTLTMKSLGVPWSFSVLPLPLIFFAGTLVRAPDWMLERKDWRSWLRVGTIVVTPIAMMSVAIATYRVLQFPDVAPKLLESGSITPTEEAFETARLYERAMSIIKKTFRGLPDSAQKGWAYATPIEKDWLDLNRESVQLVLDAAQRDECAPFLQPPNSQSQLYEVPSLLQLGSLSLFSARELESQGKLDEALTHYRAVLRMAKHSAIGTDGLQVMNLRDLVYRWLVEWAVHPQQTPENLQSAIKMLEAELPALELLEESVDSSFKLRYRELTDGPHSWTDIAADLNKPVGAGFAFLERYCPWERARALRALAVTAEVEVAVIGQAQQRIASGDPELLKGRRELQNSLLVMQATTPLVQPFMPEHRERLLDVAIDTETRRRATMIILALIAWRHEHGVLPEHLDQLIGENMRELPRDPWSGAMFHYRSDGFPSQVVFPGQNIEASQPVLWSVGATGARVIPMSIGTRNRVVYITLPRRRPVLPQSIQEISTTEDVINRYPAGIAFPIPDEP